MLLSQLAELLTAHLNSSPEIWSGDGNIVAKTELDPQLCMLPEMGVYIVPSANTYSLQGTHSRGKQQQVNIGTICSLIVSKVFVDLPVGDGVADWDEVKPLLDLRQRAELRLAGFTHPEVTLQDIESSEFEELQLNSRNFVAITNFTWQQTSCVSRHNLD